MPRNFDIKSILVIGSGPIVIGQACEFDYSGTQACKVLKEEGIRVVLVNSNPATIMTDPEMADATYIEPITPEFLEKIIQKEKPDALLATLGGQTALNAAMSLHKAGTLEKHGVKLIGANVAAIDRGENRELFKEIVAKIGGESAKSFVCHSMTECLEATKQLGYPVVVRPSFTMGGLGSGIARTEKELDLIAGAGLHHSPTSEVLLEESILGWKEYEMEVMRDRNDNVVIVCTIENVDPMGVHTGDSITVAPAMTLTDVELQRLRDLSIDIIREVGVDTGGCNIQFAVNPRDGRIIVIEMNPRVSRSSALASKATGFPIAKIATKLAIGYTLDEIKNDITKETPASFEPALDYVVVKVPRFAFDKFPDADPALTTTMKSVGEAMAIGRNFTEALQKALRSLEKKNSSFHWDGKEELLKLLEEISTPTDGRIIKIQQALRLGASVEYVQKITGFDPWFLNQICLLNSIAEEVRTSDLNKETMRKAKRHGFSDQQLADIKGTTEEAIRKLRHSFGIRPVYKTVDTCAAEFEAFTPYHYSCYDEENEVQLRTKPAVVILGSGPNRIGQGIEFDYSCVHAAMALKADGYETIMINCNPETVSTDYDTSDRLYFEPLTMEDVLEVIAIEKLAGPVLGVIVSIGGQTPLKLAKGLADNDVNILGTLPRAIDLAEDRDLFGQILKNNDILAPEYGMANTFEESLIIAHKIGYPVLVRPSFVLGGQGMKIINDDVSLRTYIEKATNITPDRPVLIDRFLESATELDVDALYDGEELFLAGVMEHVEEAGVHSGDSACVIPTQNIPESTIDEIERTVKVIAKEVGVRGLINLQMATKDGKLYVLEANPRASRTVPFVSKATGTQLAKAAARISVGKKIKELKQLGTLPNVDRGISHGVAVKEVVLPWGRFRKKDGSGVDSLLGPEMKSTGEVMGISEKFASSFVKGQIAGFNPLPETGNVFMALCYKDINPDSKELVKKLINLGFKVYSCGETCRYLNSYDINTIEIGDNILTKMIDEKKLSMVVDTRQNAQGKAVRSSTVSRGISQFTTIPGLKASIDGITSLRQDDLRVKSIQEWMFSQA